MSIEHEKSSGEGQLVMVGWLIGYCRINNATLSDIYYVQAVFAMPEWVPLNNARLQKKERKYILQDNWTR
jgi:hypothetical protein